MPPVGLSALVVELVSPERKEGAAVPPVLENAGGDRFPGPLFVPHK